MSEYFRGWKRKAGLVVLAITIAFVSGWVRSMYRYDLIKIPLAQFMMLTADSDDHSLGFVLYFEKRHELKVPVWGGVQEFFNKDDRAAHIVDHTHNYQWRCCGLTAANLPKTFQGKILIASLFIIPYWLLVAALTAVSTWLLLSKRSQSKAIEQPTKPAA